MLNRTQAMKTITTFVALTFLLALGACNTMQGFGEDVSKAGNKIESKAESKK
jgi:predicted small secreted protein